MQTLNNKWLKASVLGTTWAASEIVLGSFLHNLRVPFSGNILTAIGIIILISASYRWKEVGLFWRAGLICAIMKSLSPSAVIFGPMIGIFSEALLLEFGTRLFGRNLLGFMIGATLAMTWVLFQRIANFLIFYGADIVQVYTGLMKMAEKQLSMKVDLVWLPVVILVVVHVIFGLLAAILGIRTGRLVQSGHKVFLEAQGEDNVIKKSGSLPFNYAIEWLGLNVLLMIVGFLTINFLSFYWWVPTIGLIVTLWASRYKSALRQLTKPKFWIFFVIITMLSALVFSSFQEGSDAIEAGLLSGIQMNFRAILVIIGFAVIGKELYNPVVNSFFKGSRFSQLHLALELSFESIPNVLSRLPSAKEFFRRPVSVVYLLLSHAEEQLKVYSSQGGKIFIVTGEKEEGKTSSLIDIIEKLKSKGVRVGGFISPRIMVDGKTIGYYIESVLDGRRQLLMTETEQNGFQKIGRFWLDPNVIKRVTSTIEEQALSPSVIFIDEVGRLEMEGQGWDEVLRSLLLANVVVVIAVRKAFVNEIMKHYSIINAVLYSCGSEEMSLLPDVLREALSNSGVEY
jgi:nucleoside-triphosphatase THEP1